MVGTKFISKPKVFSDYTSLKKYMEHKYGSNAMRLNETEIGQTGTAGAVELEDNDGIAIGQIGKTEVTLILASDTDDNAYDDQTATVYYLDADGAQHSVTATFNTTSTTEVAVCSDFYCFDPAYGVNAVVLSVAVQAGDNVYIGTTGVVADPTKAYATILAAATSPTAANIRGVGSLYGRTHTNHNDGDGAILYIEYSTPWGTIGYGICTIDTTNGTTEIRFFRATASTTTILNDTLTTSTIYVDDYYRTRRLWTNQVPTSNTHEFLITDAACDNVDGSGGDVYGVIKEGAIDEIFTRHFVLAGSETYLAYIKGNVATNTDITLAITYTPYGQSVSKTKSFIIPDDTCFALPLRWQLAPLTDISFTILGNSAVFCGRFVIIEGSTALS
jgi:hypothetical protein